MELYKKIDEYLGKIAPIAFIILTFFVCINRVPWYDEGHSYIISHLNLAELFQITRTEGHTILWYLIIKPFNNVNWYPYPMIIINWLFMVCAMIIFWKKAPFNNLIKFLITFSFPIFQYYAITARPYGLGVLVIFLLTVFYKESTKRPILYSFLLILCANISVVNGIICLGFGVVFLYNIFKEKTLSKKQIFFIATIFLFGILSLLVQFIGHQTEVTPILKIGEKEFFQQVLYFTLNPFWNIKNKTILRFLLELITFIMLYYIPFVLFKKDKKALTIVLLPTILTIWFILNVYCCQYWHYYFIFILLICAFWICWNKIKTVKPLYFLFMALIMVNMTAYPISPTGKTVLSFSMVYKNSVDVILKDEKIRNGKLFCFDKHSQVAQGVLPYLMKHNITIYDNHNNDRTKITHLKNFQCDKYRALNPDEFANYLASDRDNYYLANSNKTSDYQDFQIEGEDYIIYFDIVKKHPEMYLAIFKIRAEKIK